MDSVPAREAAGGTPRLPRTVFLLGWVSLLTDVASEMVYPVLPLFLVGSLGVPARLLGLMEGASEAIVSIAKALSGSHSDRIRLRVPHVRLGYGLSAAAKPFLALAHGAPLVLASRWVDRLGKGLRSAPRDALIADVTPLTQRGSAFGFHRAMDTSGALLGTLLAAAFLWAFPGSYRPLFLATVLPGAAALAVTFLVRESRASGEGATASTEVSRIAPGEKLPLAYWSTLGAYLVFSLGNSTDAFLLLRARDLGMTVPGAILSYSLYNAVYMLVSMPAGAVSDRLRALSAGGRWRVIAPGWLLYAAVYAGFASLGEGAVPWLFAVYGIYIGLTHGVLKAVVADLAPASLRGTALGVFEMAGGFAILVGSVSAGLLWDRVGHAAPFWLGVGCALAAAGSVPFIARISLAARPSSSLRPII